MKTETGRHTDVAGRRKEEGRVWRAAFVASLLFHLLLFLFGSSAPLPLSPFSAAGPRNHDDRAAEGALQTVALQSAPPEVAISIPLPIPVPELPVEEVVEEVVAEEELPPVELPEPPGVGTTTGSDPEDTTGDSGIAGATGAGDAGTEDEGRFRLMPPTPRGMIIPPTHRSLRGREIQVWVFVDERGRVVADSTRLEPPTPDRRLNEQIIADAAQWIFNPARREGAAVASWYPYVISM